MREFVDQTTFFDPLKPGAGNCTEACVASLLGISLDSVPRFYDESHPDSIFSFWTNLREFLADRGWELCDAGPNWQPDWAIVMWVGPGPRGCNHMVLARNGEMIHDPHPSREGLIGVERVYYLIPIDPAERPVHSPTI